MLTAMISDSDEREANPGDPIVPPNPSRSHARLAVIQSAISKMVSWQRGGSQGCRVILQPRSDD